MNVDNVGTGTMVAGIGAQARAAAVISSDFYRDVARGYLSAEQAPGDVGTAGVRGGDLGAANDLDLAIEAVPENLALKLDVLRALDRPRPRLIASNTSTAIGLGTGTAPPEIASLGSPGVDEVRRSM